MRLVFNRCHGENPCGPAEGGGPCEFVDLESFINQSCKIRYSRVHPSSSRATAPKLDKTEKKNACRPTPSRLCAEHQSQRALDWNSDFSPIRRNGYNAADAQDLTQEFFSRFRPSTRVAQLHAARAGSCGEA